MLSHHRARPARGFTLVEAMVAMTVIVIIAGIGVPVLRDHVNRARRAEAVTALLALAQSQERWRGSHASYATSSEIGSQVASTPNYVIEVGAAAADGYTLQATARGSQVGDRPCQVLRLGMSGGHTAMSSGTDQTAVNDETLNRRCWSL